MNIIGKTITWLYQKYMQKQIKKEQQNRKSAEDIKKEKIYKQLKDLYNFVEWLNKKAIPNRRTRKNFWRRVANNEPLLEETLMNIIKQYAKKDEKPKKPQYCTCDKPTSHSAGTLQNGKDLIICNTCNKPIEPPKAQK